MLTPREALLLFDDYIVSKEIEAKSNLINMISQAWHNANFNNAKKLPNLNKIIKDISKNDNKKIVNKNKMDKKEMREHYQSKVVR